MTRKYKTIRQRMMAIDDILRRRRVVGALKLPNCADIAEELEVSSKTIQRDLNHLRDIEGAPIEFDRDRNGFYYTEDNYSLPAFDISETELFFLCIAERALEQYRNTPLYGKLASVVTKIRSSIPGDEVTVDPAGMGPRVSFLDAPSSRIELEVWEEISKALNRRLVLHIDYQKAGSNACTSRNVNPYHLVSYRGEWYLVGFCRLRNKIRTFAVSRVKKAERLANSFDMPEDFDAREYFSNRFGIMRSDKTYKVRITFAAEAADYVSGREWLKGQQIKKNKDGTVVLSGETTHLDDLGSWILSWGQNAKALAPRELVDKVTTQLKDALKAYKK